MQIHIVRNTEEMANDVARWISVYVKETLETSDRFTIALSGGSTPQKLFTALASAPFKEEIDWNRVHVFWGDERVVPFDDPRNNARMAFDTLLDFVPVPPEQIHVMDTNLEPFIAAEKYTHTLHRYFDGKPHTFDLVLLGMGDDGHTLSLFPGQEVVHEKIKWVDSFYLPAQDMYRITLTAPVVNLASRVAFLAAGAGKAETLRQVMEGDYRPDTYPSQQIKPANGELHWFIDEAAAKDL